MQVWRMPTTSTMRSTIYVTRANLRGHRYFIPSGYPSLLPPLSILSSSLTCSFSFDLPNMYIGSTHMSLEKLIKIRMALQSFFVAHHPSPTRLILWTNNITLLSHEHITDVLEFVDVRFWDPVIESKGTPLEGRMREENLRKNDARNYFGGDLLRFIVLYKYFDFNLLFFFLFTFCHLSLFIFCY